MTQANLGSRQLTSAPIEASGLRLPEAGLENTWLSLERAVALVEQEGLGRDMMVLMARLFPICRSITGDGVRQSLDILKEQVDLRVKEVPTGYQAFDWAVPKEWNIKDAYVKNDQGQRVVDFKASNLHVLNYSTPVSCRMTLDDLKPHLYAKPEQPDAIPYITSYYEERWGFCLTQNQLDALTDGTYEVVIDSTLENGHLTFADAVLPGTSQKEILFSTYLCHPSLANDNLSGPVLTATLYKLLSGCQLRHTYRFVFVPETIGALVYLSQEGDYLRNNLHAGYVLTCVGDDGPFYYKRSRQGDSPADKVAEHYLKHLDPAVSVNILDFFPWGSDERQYCSPGFDLPVGSLMRSKYASYPQYHTSLDNLNFVSAEGMAGTLIAYLRMVQIHELNLTYVNTSPYGEPQLGRRGLYSTLGASGTKVGATEALNRIRYLLAYADGSHDLIDIADKAGQPAWAFGPEIQALMDADLLEVLE